MSRSFLLRAGGSLCTLAALAMTACSDQPSTTQPTPPEASHLAICGIACGIGGGGGGGGIILPPPPPPPFSITALTMPNNTLPIGGVNGSYTATLGITGGAASGAALQGYIVQGSARRAAGGIVVNCNAGIGVLPTGSCQVSFSVGASNTSSGTGTLVVGIATFELDLTVGSTTVTRTLGVNLIPGAFTSSAPTAMSLSGALAPLYVGVSNSGSQDILGLSYAATVIQGTARRSAGGMPMSCGAGWGDLPGFANCGMTIYLSLTNNNTGSGTLVAGPATMQVQLLQGGTALSTKTFAITLADVHYTSITASAAPAIINGGPQQATVTIANGGASISSVGFRGVIRQGVAERLISSALLNCGVTAGVLPQGTCTATASYAASNNVSGTGTLVAGAATLALVMEGQSVLDSVNVPITLVAPPTFTNVTPAGAAKIGLPGPIVNYTATLTYAGAPIANAAVTVRIIQGSANREARSGPDPVNCGAGSGTIPTGTCTFSSFFFATNTGVGTGQFVPGAATLQIQLADPVNGILQTQLVPITLVQ